MNAKQYLQQAYRLNELINSDLLELQNLRCLSTSISSDMSQERVQSTKQSDKIGGVVAKIVDLDNQINAEIDQFVDLKKEIRGKITAIENPDDRLVLQERYLNFMTWERIAEAMHFTTQWVHEIHKRALRSLEKILNL